jgi:hypothetical protein
MPPVSKARREKGWPRLLDCLGYCGGKHLAQHAGDRTCPACKAMRSHVASGAARSLRELYDLSGGGR